MKIVYIAATLLCLMGKSLVAVADEADLNSSVNRGIAERIRAMVEGKLRYDETLKKILEAEDYSDEQKAGNFLEAIGMSPEKISLIIPNSNKCTAKYRTKWLADYLQNTLLVIRDSKVEFDTMRLVAQAVESGRVNIAFLAMAINLEFQTHELKECDPATKIPRDFDDKYFYRQLQKLIGQAELPYSWASIKKGVRVVREPIKRGGRTMLGDHFVYDMPVIRTIGELLHKCAEIISRVPKGKADNALGTLIEKLKGENDLATKAYEYECNPKTILSFTGKLNFFNNQFNPFLELNMRLPELQRSLKEATANIRKAMKPRVGRNIDKDGRDKGDGDAGVVAVTTQALAGVDGMELDSPASDDSDDYYTWTDDPAQEEDEQIIDQDTEMSPIDGSSETELFETLKHGMLKFNDAIKFLIKNVRADVLVTKKNKFLISFRGPIKLVCVFCDHPHGAQLEKLWPAWRHNILDGLRASGYK